MLKKIDWSNPDIFNEKWQRRSKRAARFVASGSTVMDIGCGKMWIEQYLPPGCLYIPVDLVSRDARTIICDLNKDEYPPHRGVTHILTLGVLEYLNDPDAFWRWLSRTQAHVILSYVTFDQSFSQAKRRHMGWVNDLSRDDILHLAERREFVLTAEERLLSSDTTLFVFSPKVIALGSSVTPKG